MIIKEVEDKTKIIELFHEAFNEPIDIINKFLDECIHKKCIGVFVDDCLKSMVFLVNTKLKGEPYFLIFAASTYKTERNKGYMTKLLQYCKDHYDKLCLGAASKELEKFYQKRGFTGMIDIQYAEYEENQGVCNYLSTGEFSGISQHDPYFLTFTKV